MWDAVDDAYFRQNGEIAINREKFVENFIRRFAENANKSTKYKIDFLDISESPPKVSVRVSSTVAGQVTAMLGRGDVVNYGISHRIDAILESPY